MRKKTEPKMNATKVNFLCETDTFIWKDYEIYIHDIISITVDEEGKIQEIDCIGDVKISEEDKKEMVGVDYSENFDFCCDCGFMEIKGFAGVPYNWCTNWKICGVNLVSGKIIDSLCSSVRNSNFCEGFSKKESAEND